MLASRRQLLRVGLAASAFVLTTGHTPYGQWTVYRQRFLLIGTCRADPPSYPLGRRIAAVLGEYLPESRARPSRAPDQWRLASLITSRQMDVILLSRGDAAALAEGRDPFADFGPVALRSLFGFTGHLLLCRPDFPDRHAYLVTWTLDEFGTGIAGAALPLSFEGAIPIHPGARAYIMQQPVPESGEPDAAGSDASEIEGLPEKVY